MLIALTTALIVDAREDWSPQSIRSDLPLYTKGTPRLHYNLVPQYNLAEDNLTGPVDSCAVYSMTIKSEWGEKSIVKDYLFRETSYTTQGYRKQRKQYYNYNYEWGKYRLCLEFIENYQGNPNIEKISVINDPEGRQNIDTYTFTVKDKHRKDVLLTRSSGEQSLWKSIIDPENGLFKLEYYDTKSSDPDITYTNFFGSLYTHKESTWMQTLKNLFNEREIMHTNTHVYALNDGLFLTPPYSGIGEYNLFENNDTHKIVRISPTQATIDEGIKRAKESRWDSDIAYCTIDMEYNSQGDFAKISYIQHELVKSKKPNGSISYTWNEKTKWFESYEYEYDDHNNWILLKNSDSDGNFVCYSREIFYSDSPDDDICLSSLKHSVTDVLSDKKMLSEGLDYKIESTEIPRLVAYTDNGIYICAIPTEYNEYIIRYYNVQTRKWQSIVPPNWDCEYCYFKDYKVVGNNVFMILSTHANGVGGTCCSYDIYKYNLKRNDLEEIIGCVCECEIIDNRIKATILEILSGDNWQNYKYKERIEWINID